MSSSQGFDVREDWTEGDIDADGVRLHFYRTGTGGQPPVVLVHGFSDNGLCWSRVARLLETAFDVVMIDARNHGRSTTASGDLSDSAEDVRAVIIGLELDRPTVVGHSIGAAAAAELAARHPGLVSRLVLEDPPWQEAPEESLALSQQRRDGARAYLNSVTTITEREIRVLGHSQHPDWEDTDIADWVVAKRQVRVEAVFSLTRSSWSDVIDRIGCPTLLIHGDPARGGIVTPALAERVGTSNGWIVTCSIENSGHNIRRENFARYSEVLGAFLTSG